MDDHGYDQAACRRAAELLREFVTETRQAARNAYSLGKFTQADQMGDGADALEFAALWLEERA